MEHATEFSSAAYWEGRYRAGGHSGAGSQGRLAGFKADFLNALIRDNAIASAIEFGCGDGRQLELLEVADYVGLDVAPTAVAQCRARFGGQEGRDFRLMGERVGLAASELGLSLDVVYHLVEDAVFAEYMEALFAHAWRFVVIYASDVDAGWTSPHVRHRRFSAHVAARFPDWRLAAVVPNLYPFDPHNPEETSFAAFHVYRQPGEACRITVPRAGCARG
jgi:SAM-dependent methyltransferase